MLSKEDYLMIQAQLGRGVYKKDIAEELGVHPRTIRRALERGGAPVAKRRRGSKLDPYKPFVDKLLQENVWNGVVIHREIQALGLQSAEVSSTLTCISGLQVEGKAGDAGRSTTTQDRIKIASGTDDDARTRVP